jgi:DNA processing protein
MAVLSTVERVEWLRLIRSENIGVKSFSNLLSLYGSAKAALEAVPHLSRQGGRKAPIKLCSAQEAERELLAAEKMGARVIAACEPDYPQLLLKTESYPPVLTIKGHAALLNKPAVGMVGARNASANGCRFAYRLAEDLGQEGMVVVSGLARGIDTASHKGALERGTVAVIAGGIDTVYPSENKSLYAEIGEKGVIVAELPFGYAPKGQNFPQRNRIIAGLSYGVTVVEATFGSGSLITARMALAENREVFAVPGFPLDPRCQGPNHLIREGATLITKAGHIVEGVRHVFEGALHYVEEQAVPAFTPAGLAPPSDSELASIRADIIQQLGASAVSIDALIALTQSSASAVLTVILELELAGKLERCPGNKVALLYE